MKSVYVVIMNCNVLDFLLLVYFILNNESLLVVGLGWVCMRACGGAHRRKSMLCRWIYF